jgi:hypothetical protein
MPTCPSCNQPVDEADAFCKRCGASLDAKLPNPGPAESGGQDFLASLPGVHFSKDEKGTWRTDEGQAVQLEMPPATVCKIHPGPEADAFEKWRQTGRLSDLSDEEIQAAILFLKHPELSPVYTHRLHADLEWWAQVAAGTFSGGTPEHERALRATPQLIVHRVHSAYDASAA